MNEADPSKVTVTVSPAASTVNATAGDPNDRVNARVAGLLANNSTTDWNAVSAFMANVVAWPGPDEPGYVNLHYSMPDLKIPGRLAKGMGWPYRDIDDFVKRVGWMLTVPDKFKDQWFCTSLQSSSGKNKRGNPKASRLAQNALKQKSIWIDCDVGNTPDKPGKHYDTVEEALRAILDFQVKVGLPPPSAIVFSGGGIHVYWISKDPMEPKEWLSYAGGLKQLLLANNIKCDTGLTTDIARILRVPGTFNYKYNPPKPVTLAPGAIKLYDFAKSLAFLQQFTGPTINVPKQPPPIFVDGVTRASFGNPHPLFASLASEPGLDAGIDKFGDRLLQPLPVFKKCGFLREALTTGGKDYDQPQWMLSVLCSTFMEDGNEIAHRLSAGHAEYSKVDTQALFDRKMADRHDRRVGYPSCAAIAGTGSKACATCPLLGKVRSPLNIRANAPEFSDTESPAAEDGAQADPSFVDPFAEFVGPEFPLDILPPTLAAFVDAEHRAMGADPAAIAMAALTAVAGAMHAETQVRAGDGWWEKPILWVSLIGPPSSMKSPIIERATKPLSRIDHERNKRWRHEHAQWAQIPKNKTIPSPAKPPRCVLNDATPEKVAELLSRDPSGALMVHDELAGWLGSFDRYSTGQSSRAFYLTSWNGGTFLKDRVGTGKNDADAEVRVDNLALSILGGIQPDRLSKLDDLTSDGLLQRFLTLLMKPAKLGDPDHPVAVAEAEYEKLIRSINALPARNYHFADEASEVRDDVLGYLHKLEQVDGFLLHCRRHW